MPLIKSASKAATQSNFHEFRHGRTFAKTEEKFGKARAEKQLQAVVLSNQDKAKRKASPKKKG